MKPSPWLLAVLWVGLIGGWFGPPALQAGESLPGADLRLGVNPTLGHLPILAKRKGLLDHPPHPVHFEYYRFGQQVMNALLQDNVDAGIVGLGPLVFASLAGVRFQILATTATYYDLYRLAVRQDRGISSIADLVGKRIAVPKESTMSFFFHNFLTENGISASKVEIVYVDRIDQMPEMLRQGEIDAFCARDPYASEAEKLLPGKISILSAPDLPANTINLVSTAKVIGEKREAFKSLLRSLMTASDQTRSAPQESLALLESVKEVDKKFLRQQWRKIHHEVFLGQELLLRMESIARWAIRNRLVPARSHPNYREYLDPSLLEEVRPEAVTLIH
ncbi:MAG: NrtA/SsuA/CpmA family ABC transporter substrate-binding protein [Magnetococcales bacterium]|nr:NrtA/SsuA/CpmA family ABC transporter substrate-binding protein [Magnetococcales bacterium]